MDETYFDILMEKAEQKLEELGSPLPSVSLIAAENNDPYRILVSTILSLRTKDKVTLEASGRLFAKAADFKALEAMDTTELAETIKPTAFYRRKAENLKTIASIVNNEYGGKLPDDMDALMKLPGVGLKTASLTLNLGFGSDAICVDCHVHQILNRLGIVRTRTAEETEKELRRILPRRFWIPLNETLVRFGQYMCTPVSPYCSSCPLNDMCAKTDVGKRR